MSSFDPACPVPDADGEVVTLAMGGGGRATERLLERHFRPRFANPWLDARHDGALLECGGSEGARLAFTTDSYVVRPLEFPGGDIGRLAVYGTVNDLAVCGARARWLSAGFILEEGLPLATLDRIIVSMAEAARECDIAIVTGDTKVVERGRGDGIYINTAGVGERAGQHELLPSRLRAGDRILVSGDLGRHGAAVLAGREGLTFETEIESDAASLAPHVQALLAAPELELRCLRDLTRGGLASALVEIAGAAGLRLSVAASDIPVAPVVRAACEVLGLDPYHLACEGRLLAFVAPESAPRALEILRSFDPAAAEIGRCEPAAREAGVVLRNALGVERVMDMPEGEQLPRIC